MLDKPIEIAEEYKENGVLPDYISEERIVNESTELLEDLEHDLKTLRY
jgi:hypothetical protein